MKLAEPRLRRFTRDEFYQMAELGFFRGKRVVLLAGEIIEMAGQGNWHSVTIGKAQEALRKAFSGPHWVRIQMPLECPDESEPEPDLAVVPGLPDDYVKHPTTALLVVEVADRSLRLDRRTAHAYAAAGVRDYWIVNLPDHWVEIHREPLADATAEFGYRYGSTITRRPGETISPVAAPNATIAIADLLPAHPVKDSF